MPKSAQTAASIIAPGTDTNSGVRQARRSDIDAANRTLSSKNVAASSTPVSTRSVSGGGSSSSRLSSNYSSSSYDGVNFGLTQDELNKFSQPRNIEISTNSLGARNSVSGSASPVIPSAPAPTNYSSDIIGNNVGLGASPDTGTFTQPVEQPKPEKTTQDTFNEFLTRQDEAQKDYEKGVEKARKQALKESGVLEARQRVQNTQNQINAVTAKMNADILSLRQTAAKEGVVEAVYGGQQAQVTYEANIKLLPLQAQLAADQGNLDLAEENLNNLYSIYSKQLDSRFNYRQSVIKATWDFYNDQEKKKIQADDKKLDFERSLIKDEIDSLQNDASQALKDGNLALYKAITNLRPPTNFSSPTYEEDKKNFLEDKAKIIMRYGGSSSGGSSLKLTNTQKNKGANNAGLSIDDFGTLDPVIQNYYVNLSKTDLQEFNDDLRAVSAGEISADEIKDAIDSSGANETLKEYLKAKVDESAVNSKTGGFISKAWEGLVNLFGN